MKTIGLLGGMSWESSAEYYRMINEQVRERLGGTHSARSIMLSVDFAEIEALQHQGRWDELAENMCTAACQLEQGGAQCIVICTNTMHRMAEQVQNSITIPLLHIADATAKQICSQKLQKVGLLGTEFTMKQDFYKGRLTEKFGLEVLIPDDKDCQTVHKIIYEELVSGIIREESRQQYRQIIRRLADKGAQAIILGCTEIMLLVSQDDSPVPVFDTTAIHATAAVDWALTDK
ncbi:aspartate/glutamate racemase family protein [Snodgrassella alvi]|uniref:aspartate/glutamate racemase family protein n=1 Tax=Snodgrassella TaxID=1193515 RepID=UPI0018DCE453|nr:MULTISPECIES: aspartate/glutamate racemase family protein [Snodgrassella]MBI0158847.1 aspartate/glutamate racemase family protein [Snodgrassella sp. W6238H11]MBI0160566.1 aspartate/glutamate racemase family protein [Snodgrassella sp. W6238H14]WLT01705.1 aspartate/glutamate racemase family protein [Snodgrassella alvi]